MCDMLAELIVRCAYEGSQELVLVFSDQVLDEDVRNVSWKVFHYFEAL